MKKIMGYVVGGGFSLVGFVMYVLAKIEIGAHTRYTWRPPYTQYESSVLMMKYIGSALLVIGLIDLALLIISKVYTSRTISEAENKTNNYEICKKCNCKVVKGTEHCPNCGEKIQ